MISKVCVNCGVVYEVSPYRSTSKYCSYRCSGMHRKSVQYSDKREIISLTCIVCSGTFSVLNMSRFKGKKTCSKECQNTLQSGHLKEIRHLVKSQTGRKRKPILTKPCAVCGVDFLVNRRNQRTQCCSRNCGQKLAAKPRISPTKDQFIDLVKKSKDTYQLCDSLNCSLHTVMRISKRLGVSYRNTELKIRPDGYFNYGTRKNHRVLYEEATGFKLAPRQSVHHIDGDKSNNSVNNLIHSEGVSDHFKMHYSIQQAAYTLFRKGLIGFDRESRRYYCVIDDEIEGKK